MKLIFNRRRFYPFNYFRTLRVALEYLFIFHKSLGWNLPWSVLPSTEETAAAEAAPRTLPSKTNVRKTLDSTLQSVGVVSPELLIYCLILEKQ